MLMNWFHNDCVQAGDRFVLRCNLITEADDFIMTRLIYTAER